MCLKMYMMRPLTNISKEHMSSSMRRIVWLDVLSTLVYKHSLKCWIVPWHAETFLEMFLELFLEMLKCSLKCIWCNHSPALARSAWAHQCGGCLAWCPPGTCLRTTRTHPKAAECSVQGG
jgi:hypothetical protein